MAEHRNAPVCNRNIRTISITSGKGGVGKTTLVANLAFSMAHSGKRILILDGDLGMANVDIMFGVRPEKTLYDVLSGQTTLAEILLEVAPNIDLIPSGSGITELQNLAQVQRREILDQIGRMESKYDVFLIDTAPGIDSNVLYLNSAAQEIHVIITPDPASIADSYALIKVLHQQYRERKFHIICNQVKDESEGFSLFQRFSDVATRFLYISLDYQGSINFDLSLRPAPKAQKLIVATQPQLVGVA